MRILKSIGKIASATLLASFSLNLALAFTFGISLKYLWNLMNTFQLVVALPLLSIVYPANYVLLCQTLTNIANLNVIPKDDIKKVTGFLIPSSSNGK